MVGDYPYGYAFISQALNVVMAKRAFVALVTELLVGLRVKMEVGTQRLAAVPKVICKSVYLNVRNHPSSSPIAVDDCTYTR